MKPNDMVRKMNNTCPRYNRAGKKVFRPHSLRRKKHASKGKTSGFKKSSPCTFGHGFTNLCPTVWRVFFSPPLLASPSHSAVAFQPTSLRFVRYSQQACRLVFFRQAFVRLSFAATFCPLEPQYGVRKTHKIFIKGANRRLLLCSPAGHSG